jgi:hypothetical protein
MITTAMLGSAEENREAEPRFQAFWRPLEPFTAGAYSGFLSEVDESEVAEIYPPATLARLGAAKYKYDPENIFSQNPNVTPQRRD